MSLFEEVNIKTPYNKLDNVLKLTIDNEPNGYRLPDLITETGSYIFVIWLKSDTNCSINFDIFGTTYTANATTSWNKFIQTVKVDALANKQIDIVPSTNSVTYYYEAYLSKGSTDTSWTPAPEDVVDDLENNYYTKSQTEARIKIEAGRIEQTVSKVEQAAITSTVEEFYQSTSPTVLSGGRWETKQPVWENGKYIWRRTLVTKGNKENSTTSYIPDENGLCITGSPGANGSIGVGIENVTNYYLVHPNNTGVTTSTPGWTTTIQTISSTNKYLWNYEEVEYTDKSKKSTTPCVIGAFGSDGKAGNGIASIVEYYQISTSSTIVPTTWDTKPPTLTPTNKFLWNYEKITYTNGNIIDTSKRVIGVYGDKGVDGTGVESTDVMYAVGSSGTTAPMSGWSKEIPQISSGQYLWTRTITRYTNKTTTTAYSVSKMGANGNDGKGIKSAEATYQISEDGVNIPTGEWLTSIPKTNPSKPYLWTRVITTYTDSTTSTSYSVGSTIEGVAVGGRNLLLKSDADYVSSNYNISNYKLTEKLTTDEVYTCRIWGTLGYGKTGFAIYTDGGGTQLGSSMTNNGDGTHTVVFKCPYQGSTTEYIYVYSLPSSYSSECTVDRIKLERGNKPTDYTVAPEDTKEEFDSAIGDLTGEIIKAKSSITQLSDSISMLVVDEKGSSLMTQKGDRWEFNMGAVQNTLKDTAKRLDTTDQNVSDAKKLANETKNIAEALSHKTAFIHITTLQNGQPAILLGQSNSQFKLRITNTSIDFLQGDESVAYISNQNLYITKSIIKDELQIGDGTGWIWKRRANGNLGLRWIG